MTDNVSSPPDGGFSPPEDEIGERIRATRKVLDISVDELAALTALCDQRRGAGISRATIYAYEANDSKPGARELRILCEALDVSPNWLLLGQEWEDGKDGDATIARTLRMLLGQVQATSDTPSRDTERVLAHSIRLDQIKGRRKR
jgi:transcriptional regulator with XRE-family HTH domain